jgi:RNA polymerase sigma-70 factor (ECF subfamily)
MMERSDEELMLNYREGDEPAFEMLYRKYERPVLDFIYRMVMGVDEAENLCQETFFRVVRARKNYQVTATFKTWLFQIALNLCRDRQRRMKHRSNLSFSAPVRAQNDRNAELQDVLADPSPDLVGRVETAELGALVQRAVAALPEAEHLVVVLKEYQGLEFSEIAEIMDCPVGTLKSLNHRAHEKLRKTLAKYLGD